jgi:hypothetical protein
VTSAQCAPRVALSSSSEWQWQWQARWAERERGRPRPTLIRVWGGAMLSPPPHRPRGNPDRARAPSTLVRTTTTGHHVELWPAGPHCVALPRWGSEGTTHPTRVGPFRRSDLSWQGRPSRGGSGEGAHTLSRRGPNTHTEGPTRCQKWRIGYSWPACRGGCLGPGPEEGRSSLAIRLVTCRVLRSTQRNSSERNWPARGLP